MVKILHVNLKPIGEEDVQFRFFWDNPNDYQERILSLAEIEHWNERADLDYYTSMPVPPAQIGQRLYNCLDGNDRVFQSALDSCKRETIVLAIAASERLANLPWELLHDGTKFLVERHPPIVPVRWVADREQLSMQNDPKNRFLNVLLMATSPRGVEPPLDFEAEEGQILKATEKKRSLCLTVEESGNLQELGELIEDYEQDYFDVVHLTGHATIEDERPYFLTETELGDRADSSAEEIASVLQFQSPKLIFLSGCRTGYSKSNAVPSMAEELLKQGATAVLSWGDRVKDDDASAAAATFYQSLSVGQTVTEALAETYQTLLKPQGRLAISKDPGGRECDREWHLLRFYVAEALPGALVTRGRKQAPRPSVVTKFVDAKKKLRLLPRTEFVGRRRQLQNCLRTLKTDWDKVGVILTGMGGWGKSAIAARLCDRLSNYETLVWWRQIDEGTLTNELGNKLRDDTQRQRLRNSTEDGDLKYRLRDVFEKLNEAGEKPFLLVFDDFEWNLEPCQGGYILQSHVARLLEALVWAVQETDAPHRIIITCRYRFPSDLLRRFLIEPLDSFHHADLLKKLRRLEHFNSDRIDLALIERALNLAAGNPRLLEWLNDEVLSQADPEARLTQLEASSEDWQGKIIWEELYQQIDHPLEKILSLGLVYEIPVPMAALEAVCQSLPDYQQQLQRGINLGLIEVSSELQECDRLYRISRILPRIIPSIQLPQDSSQFSSLHRKAWEVLTELWGNQENRNEEHWREMCRLKFAEKENPERFREGFYQMLAVQYNEEADRALQAVLRQTARELSRTGLCERLEELLRQGQWRTADEETYWIFYQLMVLEELRSFYSLCENFPSQELNEIDALWVNYSDGKFGFSVQKEILESVGGTSDTGYKTWEKFGKRVEWYDERYDSWKTYENLRFTKERAVKGEIPALWTTSSYLMEGRVLREMDGWVLVGRFTDRYLFLLFSRIKA